MIEGTGGNAWSPATLKLKTGDVVEFKVTGSRHGVAFNNGDHAKQVFEFLDGFELKQHDFPGTIRSTHANGTGINKDDNGGLLIRAKVKTIPDGVSELEYFCSLHGNNMSGKIELEKGAVPVPKVIEGTGGNAWSPATLKLKTGDVVEFKVTGSTHGVAFNNSDHAIQVFEFLDGFELKQHNFSGTIRSTHANGTGINKDNNGGLLIRAKVKAIPDGVSELNYFCSLHGNNMSGKIELEKGAVPVPKVIEGTGGNAWSPATLKLKTGDVVEFKVTGSTHGVAFNNGDHAIQVFEFLDGFELKQHNFSGTIRSTHANGTGINKDNNGGLLIRAKVKAIPDGVSELNYFCSLHGNDMSGKIVLEKDTAHADHTIHGVSDDGNQSWIVNGIPAANLDVKAGQIIEWRVREGFHGLRFTSWARDRKHIAVIKDGDIGFMHLLGRNPTASKVENDVMLRVRIDDADVGTEIPFSSLVHPSMKGKLTVIADSN
ncbi:hypothetical protein [Gimesia maris]|uniref:hypothetical protein n=1 Tax=Gimesia maris TaxID=122 RepID=UPI0002E93974|nr:hypothetical protein [Gimesia maris]QGQ29650.1 hypothetical protein F1729_13870 [Gimesia maris]